MFVKTKFGIRNIRGADFTSIDELDRLIASVEKEQPEILKQISAMKTELSEIEKNPLIQVFKEFEIEKETDKKLTKTAFFSARGYPAENGNDFTRKYGKSINRYRSLLDSISDYESCILTEERKEAERSACLSTIKFIEAEKKAMQEEKQKKLDFFLKPYREGRQICVSCLDEKTHHLVDRSEYIQVLLTFGYEVINAESSRSAQIFLKPSDGYEYTEEFNSFLCEEFEKKEAAARSYRNNKKW